MQKIIPYLWFDSNAEEAVDFYLSVFPNSELISKVMWDDFNPQLAGQLMSAHFKLSGTEFMALNGGPMYKFTPAISMYVDCTSQEEVDELWLKLTKGGQEQACGWLIDKFGVSWQIIPKALGELIFSSDKQTASKAVEAMLSMNKIEIAKLK